MNHEPTSQRDDQNSARRSGEADVGRTTPAATLSDQRFPTRRSPSQEWDLLFRVVLVGAAGLIFAAAFLWPAIALSARCFVQGQPPEGGFSFAARQAGLLWRSTWLALMATGLCLLVSLPAAYALGRAPHVRKALIPVACLLATLLCPPMVYAFGWERLLSAGFNPSLRCLLVWALWAWPIPAVILAAGWLRSGRSAYEAALLDTTPWRAFLGVGLPLLRRDLLLSALIVFVLFFNDYGVPHACGLLVFATELLGWAAWSVRVVDTLWPAMFHAAITIGALIGVVALWRRGEHTNSEVGVKAVGTFGGYGWLMPVVVLWLVSWAAPITILIAELSSPAAFAEAFRIYRSDLFWTLGLAVAAGLLAAMTGLALMSVNRLGMSVLIAAVAFGALPGALTGQALVVAYNRHLTWWVYDYWPIVLFSFLARFGWIGFAAGWVALHRTPRALLEQARVDGASETTIFFRLLVRGNWPTLACAAAVVAALATAEVAASSLVRVPSFNPIAHVLIEKFHRFEDDMLISLSMWLMAATVPAIVLAYLAARRQEVA